MNKKQIQIPGAFGQKVDGVKDLLLGRGLNVFLVEPDSRFWKQYRVQSNQQWGE